jgi:signal transduction histidine kinase
MLGYPKELMKLNEKVGLSYSLQYVVLFLVINSIGTIFLLFSLRGVGKWQKAIEDGDQKKLIKIREKCINIPYSVFLIQIGIIATTIIIGLGIVCYSNHSTLGLFLRLSTVVISFSSIIAVFSHIFTKRLFRKILLNTYNEEGLLGRRIRLRNKFFLQILPIILVSVLFISILSFSKLAEQTGSITFTLCKFELSRVLSVKSDFKTVEEVFEALKNIEIENTNIGFFTLNRATGDIKTNDGYVPGFYLDYLIKHPLPGGKVFSDNYEVQGVLAKVKIGGLNYFAGIRFEGNSNEVIEYFLISIFILLLLNIIVLYYFSKSLSDEITLVAKSLTEISEKDQVDLNKRLAVISNDEIGDLVVAFNKIREREIEYENLKDDFIVNISHELRTPINIIFSSVQLMELYTKKGSKVVSVDLPQKFNSIKSNCLRLIKIINNLIDITTVDAGFTKLRLSRTDIVRFVEKIVLSVESYAKIKGIEINFYTEIDKKEMYFDLEKIEAVVLNILSNAIKFTREGGKITAKTYEKDRHLMISVKDTGIGIPESKIGIIFERFRQVEHTFVRSFEGSGIGLSLAKLYVDLHKGKISVESEEGVGSEFIVELPIDLQIEGEENQARSENILKNEDRSSINRVDIEFSDIKLPDSDKNSLE